MEAKKKTGVTAKTILALTEQVKRVEAEKLLNAEDAKTLKELMMKIRQNWIDKNL